MPAENLLGRLVLRMWGTWTLLKCDFPLFTTSFETSMGAFFLCVHTCLAYIRVLGANTAKKSYPCMYMNYPCMHMSREHISSKYMETITNIHMNQHRLGVHPCAFLIRFLHLHVRVTHSNTHAHMHTHIQAHIHSHTLLHIHI